MRSTRSPVPRRPLGFLALALAIACVLVGGAVGTAAADQIVIESYPGPRPKAGTDEVRTVLDALASRGWFAGSDVVGRKISAVSRPSSTAGGLPKDFAQQVDAGEKAFFAGSFGAAVKQLGPLLEAARDNPSALAAAPALRDDVLRALIALALSQQKLGDPSATRQTFGEILRSFPKAQISRSTYGPDAHNLFEQMRKEATERGTGKLAVRVAGGAGNIYVNEAFTNMGAVDLDVLAGEYRVFVKLDATQASRIHRATVTANGVTTLTINPMLDAVVQVTPAWTGLQFATSADRTRLEGAMAKAFGDAIGADAVAVVGIDRENGQPVVFGALINRENGDDLRRASVSLATSPSPETLHGLARFLARDIETAPGLNVQVTRVAAREPAADGSRSDSARDVGPRERGERPWYRWGGIKWITGSLALVGAGVTIGFVAYDGDCSQTPAAGFPCPKFYNFTAHAFGTGAAAAGLAAISLWQFLADDPWAEKSGGTAFVAPTGDGAVAGYRGSF